jgi:hypothetical protein
MSEIANFFWAGNSLSIYEQLSLKSFLLNNFIVRVWSYDKLDLPNGIELMDAEKILPKVDLHKYNYLAPFSGHSPKTDLHKYNHLAPFSDVFRFKLLSERNGEWWFDIDCICLKNEKKFKQLKKDKKIIVAWEDSNFLNGACLNFIDNKIGLDLVSEQKNITNNKVNLIWGDLCPRLLTNWFTKNNLLKEVLNKNTFYPIHYTQTRLMNNPRYTKSLKSLVKDSYVCHLWNEILSKEINKNIHPNKGSFLDYLFEINN